jgi:hypothetical protein
VKSYFAPFKIKDCITLIFTIVIGFTWIMISHYVLSQSSQRFIAFSALIMLFLYLQYFINRPMHIWQYANTLSLILLLIVILISIIMHVIVKNDLSSKILHLLLLCLITSIVPYLMAFIYMITRKNKARTPNNEL